MEGFGILNLMKELEDYGFIVDKVCHDKDSSALKQVKDIFEDVEEVLCTSMNKFCFVMLILFKKDMD